MHLRDFTVESLISREHSSVLPFFFFNDTATTEIYTVSLHDALPISNSAYRLAVMALTYAVVSVPFFFSGVSVCLALTRFPRQVSMLYAADLAGAASGCVLLIYALKTVGGPTSVFLVALVASGGGMFICLVGGLSRVRALALIVGM